MDNTKEREIYLELIWARERGRGDEKKNSHYLIEKEKGGKEKREGRDPTGS